MRPDFAPRRRFRAIASWRLAGVALVLAATTRAAAQTSVVGQWATPVAWPLAASHAALLSDGKVMVWSDQPGYVPRVWDPATNGMTTLSQVASNLIGSGHALLDDGDVAIVGGRLTNGTGIQDAHWYDRAANGWFNLQYMTQPRSEPTAILLGDARILALSGQRVPGQPTDIPEYNVPVAPWMSLGLALLGLPRTPWAFQLSDGRVLVAGPDRAARKLDVGGDGSWSAVDNMLSGSRDAGSAVLVPGATDRVLVIGGRNPATSSCEVLDVPVSGVWVSTGSMTRARRHHNATILADGSVLVTGGTLIDDALEHAVLPAERWMASTGIWTTLASMNVSRRRGSVALLLPDGRVLCAGGGDGTAGSELHADAQIYSPPYLFQGARPTITTAPATLVYGSSFNVDSPQAPDVDTVWLVRSGSVTRGFNSDQRALSLPFTLSPGRLTMNAPANGNVAPPGMYILFLVNDPGVPSVGKLVRLGVGTPVLVAPTITSTAPTTTPQNAPFDYVPSASGTQPMTWSLVSAPSWLSISPSSGAIGGVPTTTGQFNISLRATNQAGSNTQTWTLTVTSGAGVRNVIALGALWRYFKGTLNPPSNWATLAFDDATWLQGPSGFGMGDADDATVLADMVNNYSTVFTRKTFTCYNVSTVSKISILYEYDDGFVVYLNGTRIFEQRAPAVITNTSLATSAHEISSTVNLIRQDLTAAATRALLVNGTNVLAAVGLNNALNSSDLTLKITLELTGGTETPVDAGIDSTAAARTFMGPTPNPFTATTRLQFTLAQPGTVRWSIFDPAGRLVRRMESGSLTAGRQTVEWDGRDGRGRAVVPGVYLYRLQGTRWEHRGKVTVTH